MKNSSKAADFELERVNLHIKEKKINWILNPFPHVVIDNFLPKSLFDQVSSTKPDELDDLRRTNITGLEFNKKEYGIKGKSQVFRIPIEIMGFGIGKNLFSKFVNPSKIITLASHNDFGGYYPYHSSSRNGILGSHLDHCFLGDNIHFANSIFYAHKVWEKEWKGETILFNHNGLKPLVYIEPKPNRMVLFIHSNTSFHGVNRILCPETYKRNTYYMDYYLESKDIKHLVENIQKAGKGKPKLSYSFHQTTFIPFFPFGINSRPSLNKRRLATYIRNYVVYLFFKTLPIDLKYSKKFNRLLNKFKTSIKRTFNKFFS